MELKINSIKTSKGVEIIIDMNTLYSQLCKYRNQLSKKDLINIAHKINIQVKEYKSKTDIFDDLINNIYQSNYIDSIREGYKNKSW